MHSAKPQLRLSYQAPLRLLAVGDCNTHTIDPTQGTVADGVVDALENCGFDVQLDNIGFGMSSSREGLSSVIATDSPADLAILNFGLVDAWRTTIPQFYVPYYPDNKLRKRLRKVLKFVKRGLRSPFLRSLVPRGPVVPQNEFRDNMTRMVRIIRERNPSVEIYIWATVPVAGDSQRNLGVVEYNEILSRVAEDEAVQFVESQVLLQNRGQNGNFIDGVHLSKAAASAIGEHIAKHYIGATTSSAESHGPRAA